MARKSNALQEGDELPLDETCSYYEEMFSRYDREFKPWEERAQKIMDIYTEQRKGALGRSPHDLPLLWANINVLQPAVYNRTPQPVVSRRFRDTDPVARAASELIERCLHYSFDMGDVDSVMRMVRDDALTVGRGTARVRFEEPSKLSSERVCFDYVHWKDFGHNVCRSWAEVTDVWFKNYMTRKQLQNRFGDTLSKEEIALIPLGYNDRDEKTGKSTNDQAIVYEIWCKTTRKVSFIVRGFHKPLEQTDAFLDFEGFFPCPKPVYSTLQAASLIPVPDFVYYQSQAEQIDELTLKIKELTEGLKLVGFYPADLDGDGQAAIEKAASPSFRNKLVPVKNWASFTAGSGGGASIVWWPAGEVAKTIRETIEVRKQLVDDIYAITGISDILRGDGQASETATAQNIKSQWGSMRIRDRQITLAAFARGLSRLGAEVISENFSPETLLAMSNMNLQTKDDVQKMIAKAQAQAMAPAQPQAQQPPHGAGAPV